MVPGQRHQPARQAIPLIGFFGSCLTELRGLAVLNYETERDISIY